VLVAPLHDGSEIAWGPRACCRGGRGGDGTYISHRIWWMLWEDHSRISRSRSSSATTGAGRIRGPLGDLWLKSRRQGKIGSASLLALWTTFVGCRSSFSRWLGSWLAGLLAGQKRSGVCEELRAPSAHWATGQGRSIGGECVKTRMI
jgi:hypothetical protein